MKVSKNIRQIINFMRSTGQEITVSSLLEESYYQGIRLTKQEAQTAFDLTREPTICISCNKYEPIPGKRKGHCHAIKSNKNGIIRWLPYKYKAERMNGYKITCKGYEGSAINRSGGGV